MTGVDAFSSEYQKALDEWLGMMGGPVREFTEYEKRQLENLVAQGRARLRIDHTSPGP